MIEDSFLLRTAVTRLLDDDPRTEVVGSAADFDAAVRLVIDERPDAVVTDVRMPPSYADEGICLAAKLRAESPSTGVVVLSQHADAVYALGLVESGSRGRGYLLKERLADEDQLVEAVVSVASGGAVLDPAIVDAMIASRRRTSSHLDALTVREREVLAAVASGANNTTIADRLTLSTRSVEKHINAIFSKLGLSSDMGIDRRVQATLLYLADSAR